MKIRSVENVENVIGCWKKKMLQIIILSVACVRCGRVLAVCGEQEEIMFVFMQSLL